MDKQRSILLTLTSKSINPRGLWTAPPQIDQHKIVKICNPVSEKPLPYMVSPALQGINFIEHKGKVAPIYPAFN